MASLQLPINYPQLPALLIGQIDMGYRAYELGL